MIWRLSQVFTSDPAEMGRSGTFHGIALPNLDTRDLNILHTLPLMSPIYAAKHSHLCP